MKNSTSWVEAHFLIILCFWLKNQGFLELPNIFDQYEKKIKGFAGIQFLDHELY